MPAPLPSWPLGLSAAAIDLSSLSLSAAPLRYDGTNDDDDTMDLLTFPAADTARFMAALLDTISSANDAARASGTMPAQVSRFHARAPPPISVHAYLARILKYAPCENAVFIAVLVYLDRMARARVPFVVCTNNVHRLLITAIMVATKFHSDVFFTNVHYAKVGGVTVAELNMLELEFLFINEFNLAIHPTDMQRYADRLLDHAIKTKLALPRLPATKPSTLAAAVPAAAPATTTTPSPSLAAATAPAAPPAPAPVPASSSTPAAAAAVAPPRYPTPIPPTIGTPPARVRPQPAAPQRNPSSLYISTRAPPSPRSARALHMLAHRGLTAAVAAMHMDAPKRMPSLYSTAAAAVQAASASAARTGTAPVPACATPLPAAPGSPAAVVEPTHVVTSPVLTAAAAAASPAFATASPRRAVASPATPKTPLGPRATIRAGKSLPVLPRRAQLPPGYVPPGTRARGAGPHDSRPSGFRYPTAFPAAKGTTTTPSTTPPTSPCVTTAAAAAAVMANLRKGAGGGGAGSPAVPPAAAPAASPMHVVRG
ncbi:hypothetical protein GGF32_007789 [Allomyces javanicus]|nr:hypothetical protein GGF32_007789 [Allomyces javanicus]